MQYTRTDTPVGIICGWEKFEEIIRSIAEGVTPNPSHALMNAEQVLAAMNREPTVCIQKLSSAMPVFKKSLDEDGHESLSSELAGNLAGLTIRGYKSVPDQPNSYFFQFMTPVTGDWEDVSTPIATAFDLPQGLQISMALELDTEGNRFVLNCDQLLQSIESNVFPDGLIGHGLASFIVGQIHMRSFANNIVICSGPGFHLTMSVPYRDNQNLNLWDAKEENLFGPLNPNSKNGPRLKFEFSTQVGYYSNIPLNSTVSIESARAMADKLEAGLKKLCGNKE